MASENPPTETELTVLHVAADHCVVGSSVDLYDAQEEVSERFHVSAIDFNLAIRRLVRLGLLNEEFAITSEGWELLEGIRAKVAVEQREATRPGGAKDD